MKLQGYQSVTILCYLCIMHVVQTSSLPADNQSTNTSQSMLAITFVNHHMHYELASEASHHSMHRQNQQRQPKQASLCSRSLQQEIIHIQGLEQIKPCSKVLEQHKVNSC